MYHNIPSQNPSLQVSDRDGRLFQEFKAEARGEEMVLIWRSVCLMYMKLGTYFPLDIDTWPQWPLLQTWFNFNPSMDK